MWGVRYGGGGLHCMKRLVDVLMLQWLWPWFALSCRLSDAYYAKFPSWQPHIRLKRLVHEFMLQCLQCWFTLISHLSDIYSAYLPHDVLIFQFWRRCVVCIFYWCTYSRSTVSQLKTVGRVQTFETWLWENGVKLDVEDKKGDLPFVDMVAIVAEVYGAVCQLYVRLRNTTLAK